MLGFYEEFDESNQEEENNIKSLDRALFETDILKEINIFIPSVEVCQGFFYYITAYDNSILIEKKDFKLSTFDTLEFDISNLTDIEKEKAVSLAYSIISVKLEPNRNNSYIKYIEERVNKKFNNKKNKMMVKSLVKNCS